MAVEALPSTGFAKASRTSHRLLDETPPVDPPSRLAWAEEQRRAWMQLAQDAEHWIEQLEHGRTFMGAQLERQAQELEAQTQRLEKAEQTRQALERCLNQLRRRVQDLESSRDYRVGVWLNSQPESSRLRRFACRLLLALLLRLRPGMG